MAVGRKIVAIGWLFLVMMGMVFAGQSIVPSASAASEQQAEPAAGGYVYVIPVQMTVQGGLESFLNRALTEAEEARADLVILNVNTPGGELKTAEDIALRIRESKVPTVAFVSGMAASAGAYLSLNADEIVMSPASSIGAAMIVDQAGNAIENPKTVGFWRSQMESAAEMNGRNPNIAVAMVDPNVVLEMPEIGKTKKAGEILSLTAQEALKVGYADHVAKSVDEAITWKGITNPTIVQLNPSFSEKVSQWLTSPGIATLLLIIGIAGIAIEFIVPGFGIPGIVGLAAFCLYFFGSFIAGFAGMEAIIFFIAGIVLLVIEMFVPSFGVLGILGIIGVVYGIAHAAFDTGHAMRSLGLAALVAVVVIAIVVYAFRKRGVWNRFILREQLTTDQGYVPNASREHMLGLEGTALSLLRPAGVAEIDGQRVDVVTSGEYIEPGSKVRVTSVDGTRIVVKEIGKA